ncbi:hypothetical protein [Sandarakinorhabdus sp.]|uniref:hypothetical protein n=1 Tax=Sandarakinorhabdus sp. TaxID=1916663 RepID=UPI003340C5AA
MDISGFEAGVDGDRGSNSAAAPAPRQLRGNMGASGISVSGISGRRLRWGLTGLAAVFLIVMAAAAGRSPAGNDARPAGAGEPLAVLGVAPGPATHTRRP